MNENIANGDVVGRLPSAGVSSSPPHGTAKNAGLGNPAYNDKRANVVGRVSPHGAPNEPPPRRLRRLHRVWPDRDGNISYLLTLCVDGRARVLDNEAAFERLVAFLLDSPRRYHWFGRRFVIMPDHIHLIANMGRDAVRLGQWIKALKAVVGGLERRAERPVRAPGLQSDAQTTVGRLPSAGATSAPPHRTIGRAKNAGLGNPAYKGEHANNVGRVPPHGDSSAPTLGVSESSADGSTHEFTRIKRAWRWQESFHDHKFRSRESETRKWEYVCLNPVRAGLVKCPEEWPFGGEIFYDETGGPRLVRGTPPLLETGLLIEAPPVEGKS